MSLLNRSLRSLRPQALSVPSTTIRHASYASTRASPLKSFSRGSLRQEEENKQLDYNLTRRWRAGDVYAPHDLSGAEMRKWRRRNRAPTTDAFDALSLDPLDCYKNFSIMSEYVTEMGRIRARASTGLRRVNQRRLGRAIRRAVALGLMPSVHRHPMILKWEIDRTGAFY